MGFNRDGVLRRDARPRPAVDRWRRTLAGGASILLHIGLFILVFARLSGALVAADGSANDAGAMTVSLVPASSLELQARSASAPSLTPLLAKFGSDQPPIIASPDRKASDLERLFQRLHADPARASLGAQGDAVSTSQAKPAKADAPAPAESEGKLQGPAGAARAGSTGSLWGVVAPCWRDLASGSHIPIDLEVVLDAKGQLAIPPKILRPPGARLDENRLRAEANALNALMACLPRADLQLANRVYRLQFPAA